MPERSGGLTLAGIRSAFAAAQAERAELRARIDSNQTVIAEQSRLIAELRVRLAKVEAVPSVRNHL